MLLTSVHNYSVADFLELRNSGRLIINRDFQRNSVWKTPGKVYLIDSILRGYPIPKMYFRSTIDPATQSSVREVVDGQQRLLAIFDFADDKLTLTSRAGDLRGLKYSKLDEDQKTQFLAYTFTAEQFINADDNEILEVFARINSYTVALNPPELRHAQYQGDFKWLVRELSQHLSTFWSDFGVFSLAQRSRMLDDGFVADCLLQITQGITGGEAKTLDRAYRELDSSFPELDTVREIFLNAISLLDEHLEGALVTPLTRPAHLVMLATAAAHVQSGIQVQDEGWVPRMENLPARPTLPKNAKAWEAVRDNLLKLATVIELPEPPPAKNLAAFWRASTSAPINLSSRRIRFPAYVEAFDV